MTDQGQLGGKEALAELVAGLSDDEINAMAAERDVDSLLDQIFAGMQSGFVAENAAGEEAVILWVVNCPHGPRPYLVTVADDECRVERGSDPEPRVTFTLTLPNFLRFISGDIDGVDAYMDEILAIDGDLMFAATMQAWFGR
jgi:putative sterol carrier protein